MLSSLARFAISIVLAGAVLAACQPEPASSSGPSTPSTPPSHPTAPGQTAADRTRASDLLCQAEVRLVSGDRNFEGWLLAQRAQNVILIPCIDASLIRLGAIAPDTSACNQLNSLGIGQRESCSTPEGEALVFLWEVRSILLDQQEFSSTLLALRLAVIQQLCPQGESSGDLCRFAIESTRTLGCPLLACTM